MTRDYSARVSEINLVIDKNMNFLQANRGFLRFLNMSNVEGNLEDYIIPEDVEIFKLFLQSLKLEDNKQFIIRLKVRKKYLTCILSAKIVDDEYHLEIKEIEYTKEIYNELSLKKLVYESIVENVNQTYLLYNCADKSFEVNNTRYFGRLCNGNIDDLKIKLCDVLRLINDSENEKTLTEMINDIEANLVNIKYKLMAFDTNYILYSKLLSFNEYKYIIFTIAADNSHDDLYFDKTDVLTGLYNKKTITEMANNRINKNKVPCTIFIMDVDKFKLVNDTFGHQYGDEVLKGTGKVIRDAIGSKGAAGRYGGDEFLFIIDSTDESDIRNIARNVKIGLEWAFLAKHPDHVITCSMGIAKYPDDGVSFKDVLDIADKCLYLAKNKGRNSYVIYNHQKHNEVFKANELQQEKLENGSEYLFKADKEIEILKILTEKKENYLYNALNEVKEYLKLSKITLYNEELRPEIMIGDDDLDIREQFIRDDDYFDYFNANDFMVLDNIQNLEPVCKKKCKMYQNNDVASTIEILIKEKGIIKGLLTLDVLKPARTFGEHQKIFALIIAKLLK